MKNLIVFASLFLAASASAFTCTANKICTGERVINLNGYPGTVAGIMQNGDVMVKFDIDPSKTHKWSQSDLAMTKGCSRKLCVGDSAYNSNGYRGTVGGIMQNGDVMMKFDIDPSKHHKWATGDMGLTKGCTTDDYCVSDIVINANGYPGVVTAIFRDKVGVLFDIDRSKLHLWNTADLAITQACQDRSLAINR